MKIICETCDHPCPTFSKWMDHLVSSRHQACTTPLVSSWPKECVLVIRPKPPQRSLPRSALDLIWHFSSCGMVADVHYPQDMSFCLVLFDESNALSYAIEYDAIDGTRIVVKKWNQLGRAEANQLMSSPSPSLASLKPESSAAPQDVSTSQSQPQPVPTPAPGPGPVSVKPQTGGPAEPTPGPPRPQLAHTPAGHKYVSPSSLVNGTRTLPPFASTSTTTTNDSNVTVVDKNKTSAPPRPEPVGNAGKGKAAAAKAARKKKQDAPAEAPMDPFERRHLELLRQCEAKGLDLDQQVAEWVQAVTLAAGDMTRRNVVLTDLRRSLESDERTRNVSMYPFGSFITGLGDKDSDLDIYVNFNGAGPGQREGSTNQPLSSNAKRQLLDLTKQILRRQRGLFPFLLSIRTARVPILKATHFNRIQMDLSFENMTSVRNSELIAFYQRFDPRVKYLMLIVRYWAKFHGLSGSVLIKNYALVLLVIVFLARKGLAPSVHVLQTLATQKLLVDGWNVAFSNDMQLIRARMNESPWRPAGEATAFEINPRTQCPTARSFLTLAAEFFDMFGGLDYSQLVVCSLTAEFLPKTQFEPGYEVELPPALDLYKAWAFEQSQDTRFDTTRPFCLQDPFQLDFNVGTCVKKELLDDFAASCDEAAAAIRALLQQEPNDPPKSLLSMFVPRSKRLTKKERRRLRRMPPQRPEATNGVPNRPMCSVRLVPGPYFTKEALFANFGELASDVGEEEGPRLMSLWCMYVKDFFKVLLTDAYKMQVKVLDLPPPADTEPRIESEFEPLEDRKEKEDTPAVGQEGGRNKRRLPDSPPNEDGSDAPKEEGANSTAKPLSKVGKTETENVHENEAAAEIREQKMEITPPADERMEYTPDKLKALLDSLRHIPSLEEHTRTRLALSATCHPHFNQNHRHLALLIKKEKEKEGGKTAVSGAKGLEDPFKLEAEVTLRAMAKTESRRMTGVTFHMFGRLELERRRRGSTEAMSPVPVFVVELPEDLFCAWFLRKKYSELLAPYLQHRVHQWMLFA